MVFFFSFSPFGITGEDGHGVAFWEYYELESDNRTTRHNEMVWLGAWDNSYLSGGQGEHGDGLMGIVPHDL